MGRMAEIDGEVGPMIDRLCDKAAKLSRLATLQACYLIVRDKTKRDAMKEIESLIEKECK